MENFIYPTKLISRTAVAGQTSSPELDMNITANEEVSDSQGPINNRMRSIGYFSQAFLPTSMTIGLKNKDKNRSDPYYVARDYNAYLADLQKNSSLTVSSSTYAPIPSIIVSNSSQSVTPIPGNVASITVRKPYDLGINWSFAQKKYQELAGLPVAVKKLSGNIDSGKLVITDPAVYSCLGQTRSISCLKNYPIGSLRPPFSILNARIYHDNGSTCPILSQTCIPRPPEDRFELPAVDIMSPESDLFRPHDTNNPGWFNFVRCEISGNDRSSCRIEDGPAIRRGQKRNAQTSVERLAADPSSFSNLSQFRLWSNATYYAGLFAPQASSDIALFTSNTSTLRRGEMESIIFPSIGAEDVGLKSLPSSSTSGATLMLGQLGYTASRIQSIAGPLVSSDGGASYFEGTLGLPLMGIDSKLWLEWYETGALSISTSHGAIAYYRSQSGFDAFTNVAFGFLNAGSSGGYLGYSIIPEPDESPPAAWGRIVTGITPYASSVDRASQNGCVSGREGEKSCFAASRMQKVAVSDTNGGGSLMSTQRKGMSAYLFKGCRDNLANASRIKPSGDIGQGDLSHGFKVSSTQTINLSDNQEFSLYLPFAIRDVGGPYFGPVVGENYRPLYPDGFRGNVLVLSAPNEQTDNLRGDRSQDGRIRAGVDVYKTSQQKNIAEAPRGETIILFDSQGTTDRLPRASTLDRAIDDAKDITLNPLIPGSKAYESPLAISPDVLLGVFSHDDLGDSSMDGDVVGSKAGTAVYLMAAISELSNTYTKQQSSEKGYALNRLVSVNGVAQGMILSPTYKEDVNQRSLSFAWIISDNSLLATVTSPGVSDGPQTGDATLSGGVINGLAGGVAIEYGSVLGGIDDSRNFDPVVGTGSLTIKRSQGVLSSIMSGAGFKLNTIEKIQGITAKIKTRLDGVDRMSLGDQASTDLTPSSAFFLADDLCGEAKLSSSLTSTRSLQNASYAFGYCVARSTSGVEKPIFSLRSIGECHGVGGEWRNKVVTMKVASSTASDKNNPYAAVCSYAAIRGRQTSTQTASRWDETSSLTPTLVNGACQSSNTGGLQICAIDTINTMNNQYWDTQSVNITYGYDAYGMPTDNPLIESENPVSPTQCPAGTNLMTQTFIASTNPLLQTFTAADNFAGANFDTNGRPVCPFSCSVTGEGIVNQSTCEHPNQRPAASQGLPSGNWSPMTKVASVNVSLFADKDLCYSESSGASVRDMRTEDQKKSGSLSCGGTYGKCSKPGRFNQAMCQSDSLPGGAGVWTENAPTDSSFKPTVIYGLPTSFMLASESVSSSALSSRSNDQVFAPYTILVDVAEINRRTAASLGAGVTLRAGQGSQTSDNLGYIWMKESVYEKPMCQNFFYSKADGVATSLLAANTSDIGVLSPRSTSTDEKRRYGSLDPFMVRTKARQVTIEGGAGTNIAAYADFCDFSRVEPADQTPVLRPGYTATPSLVSGVSINEFSRRAGIDYISGQAVSVTRLQPTPWSSELVDGNGFTAPSCDVFNDPGIAAREGRVLVANADLPANRSFMIGEDRAGVDRRTPFRSNPITMQDSSSRNEVPAFSYGGSWYKVGEERLVLTRDNSAVSVNCRIYKDSADGSDTCDGDVSLSTESVDGQTFNVIAENGENGGAAGSAVILSTTKPQSVSIQANGGQAGAAGSTTLDGAPQGNMMCYSTGIDILNPSVRIYKFRQNSATVKPASNGNQGPGGDLRAQQWWGIAPEARKWLQRQLQQ